MKLFYFITAILLISVNILTAQWEYKNKDNKNEVIFVNDDDDESSFLIERKNKKEIVFYIKGITADDCKIESIKFQFDGINEVLYFKTEAVAENKLIILIDDVKGLDYLKSFSKLIKERNIIYLSFINNCNLTIQKDYSLKGSSKAINQIDLIPFLNKTIKITEAKREKIKFIEKSLPRLESKSFPANRLGDINPLEITDVYWKSNQNDKYHIRVKLRLNGVESKELFGKFRLYKPVDKIKSRY